MRIGSLDLGIDRGRREEGREVGWKAFDILQHDLNLLSSVFAKSEGTVSGNILGSGPKSVEKLRRCLYSM